MTDIALPEGSTPQDPTPGGDPLVRIEPAELELAPGGTARVGISVLNPTTLVQRYDLDVLGPAAAWCTIEPSTVEMFPGQGADATLLIRPPRSADEVPRTVEIGVRARSAVDRRESSVEELRVQLAPFSEVDAWIRPRQSKIRWRRRFKLILANNGNVSASVSIAGLDPNESLHFPHRPRHAEIPAGSVRIVRYPVAVRPRLSGTMEPHQFQVHVLDRTRARGAASPTSNPVIATLDAMVIRHPILGSWFSRFASMLTVVAVVFAFVIARQDQVQPGEPTTGGPPPVPADAAAAATGPSAIAISWTDSGGETGVRIFQQDPAATSTTDAAGGCASCSQVGEVTGQVTTFTVDKLTPATQYCFRLAAVNGDAISALTPAACATTPEDTVAEQAAAAAAAQAAEQQAAAAAQQAAAEANKAQVPDGVTATPGDPGSVVVAWNDASAGSASFDVAKDGTSIAQVVPGHTTFVATGLTPGSRICFQVKAIRADTTPPTQSAYSAVTDSACAVPIAPLPLCPPTGVAVDPVERSDGPALRVTWSAPVAPAATPAACQAPAALTFEVQEVYVRGAEVVASPPAGDSAVTIGALASGSTHCYAVRTVLGDQRSETTEAVCGVAPVVVTTTTTAAATTSVPTTSSTG